MTGLTTQLEPLALAGGPRVRTAPLPPWPHYDDAHVDAATRVLRSGKVNYWTGDECRRFEDEFAAYHGVAHAVALANGTLALDLALRILGIGAGDEVIVTPRTLLRLGQHASCWPARTRSSPTSTRQPGHHRGHHRRGHRPRTKAILVVHLAGWPCDMPSRSWRWPVSTA